MLLGRRLVVLFVRKENNEWCATLDRIDHEYFTELRGATFKNVSISDSDELVGLFVHCQLWRVHRFESTVVRSLRYKKRFKWVRKLNFKILIWSQSPYCPNLRQLLRLFKLKSCSLEHTIESGSAFRLITLNSLLQISNQPLRLLLLDIRQFR